MKKFLSFSFMLGMLSISVFPQGTPVTLPLTGELEYKPSVSFIYKSSMAIDSLSVYKPGDITGPSTFINYVLNLKSNKVGIGTTSPSEKLHVNGNGMFSGSGLFVGQLTVGNSSMASLQLPALKLLLGDMWTFSDLVRAKIMGYNCRFWDNDLQIGRIDQGKASAAVMMNQDGSINLCTTSTPGPRPPAVVWNYFTMLSNGNVGIGIESPQKKLHVQGETYLNGNVGIGTNNPTQKLQIGTIWTFHDGGTKYIGRNVTYTSGQNVRMEQGGTSLISFGNGSISLETAGDSAAGTPVNAIGRLTLIANGNVGIGITNPQKKLHVQGDTYLNGNVGIGTDDPQSKLQVKDGAFSIAFGSSYHKDLNYGTSYMGFNATRKKNQNGNWIWELVGDGAHNGGSAIWSTISGDIYFASIPSNNGNNKTLSDIQIRDNIKLHLTPDGVLRAKEVLVTLTGWPDYVFAEDYSLQSLDEVASYIEQNKHLPEMPSATEVAENGVNLGEMNALLLKKVEELTLYILQQNGDIQVLKEEIRLLKEGR